MIELESLYQYRRIDLEMKLANSFGHSKVGVFVFQSPVDKKQLRCVVSKDYVVGTMFLCRG